MAQYVETTWLETHVCGECGVTFAMPTKLVAECLKDHSKSFYCPNGHGRVFAGKTEAQKLREEVQRKNDELDRTNAALSDARGKVASISRAHHKMRQRVANGVCPCCNRTFQNLMSHMSTEHPEFKSDMRTLRLAFGMTQQQVADEVGTPTMYVSEYERGKYVPKRAKQMLDSWLAEQTARRA